MSRGPGRGRARLEGPRGAGGAGAGGWGSGRALGAGNDPQMDGLDTRGVPWCGRMGREWGWGWEGMRRGWEHGGGRGVRSSDVGRGLQWVQPGEERCRGSLHRVHEAPEPRDGAQGRGGVVGGGGGVSPLAQPSPRSSEAQAGPCPVPPVQPRGPAQLPLGLPSHHQHHKPPAQPQQQARGPQCRGVPAPLVPVLGVTSGQA